MSFKNWKRSVDYYCAAFYHGMTTDDFEDYLWYDDYSLGLSPWEAFCEWREELAA